MICHDPFIDGITQEKRKLTNQGYENHLRVLGDPPSTGCWQHQKNVVNHIKLR